MQRSLWMKDGQDELNGKISVDRHACFLVNTNRRVALDRDERTELLICQLHHCLGQIVNRFDRRCGGMAGGADAFGDRALIDALHRGFTG